MVSEKEMEFIRLMRRARKGAPHIYVAMLALIHQPWLEPDPEMCGHSRGVYKRAIRYLRSTLPYDDQYAAAAVAYIREKLLGRVSA